MRYLIFLFAAAMYAQTQTTIPPSMLRESNILNSPPSEIRFYAVDLKGDAFRVKPGAGLVLRQTPGGWVLDASPAPPAPLQQLVPRVLQSNAWGHYVVAPEAIIFRNGMLMAVGGDYDHNGAGVLPKTSWAGDVIVALELQLAGPVASGVAADRPTLARVEQVQNWDQVSNRAHRPPPDPLYLAGIGTNQLRPGRIGPEDYAPIPRCLWWAFAFVRQPAEDAVLIDCGVEPPTITAQR